MKLLKSSKKSSFVCSFFVLLLFANLNVISAQNTPSKNASGQNKTLKTTGRVVDDKGESIIGASVVEKGTTNGTITDIDGNFVLNLQKPDASIIVSYIGMNNQTLSASTNMNIKLSESSISLDEVVAIGYGTARKSDLTGAISSVKLKDATLSANTNFMQALQGSVPGLNIGAVSSAGGEPSMLIRGQTSLSGGTTPLIVLDGVIFHGSLSDISTNDIERVDVLKDASSLAVYGSNAANGVIIITTKKGTSEKPSFNFNTYSGIQQMSNKVQMAGGDKYVQKVLDWRTATGKFANPELIENYLKPLEIQNYRDKTYTDWFDILTRTAPITQYDLSVSGKSSKTTYYLSGSYTNQEGVVIGDDFSRLNLRANFTTEINTWLTVGMNASYSNRDYSGKEVEFGNIAAYASPLSQVRDSLGQLILYPHDDQATTNPFTFAKAKDEDIRDNLFSVFTADIKVPGVKGLKYHFDFSNNLNFEKHNEFYGQETNTGINAPGGLANKYFSEYRNWTYNNILSYTNKFGKHAIDGTMLYSREAGKGESTFATAKSFANESLGWNSLESGTTPTIQSGAWENTKESFMVRANYVYDLKYLLTATVRRDGSSTFGPGNKFGNFPSLAAGWVLSEENFLKNVRAISYLKLRASYGINGNDALNAYSSLSQMGSSQYVFGDGGGTSVGTFPSTMANSGLKWEKTTSINLGLNVGVLDNRISADIDVYSGHTDDLLVRRGLPTMTGYNIVWSNLGKLANKGIEFSLNTINIKTEDFTWTTRGSFSLNRNKIVSIYGQDLDNNGIEDDDIGNNWFIGKPIGAIYDYSIIGMYQTDDTDIPTGYRPGYYKFAEIDGQPDITPTDRSVIGYTGPNYRFGIFNEFAYKKISLSVMINSVQGGKDYYRIDNRAAYYMNAYFANSAGRLNIPDMDYWTPTNPSVTAPRLDYNPKYQHGVYEDRSFVRLQDVTLAYNFEKSFLTRFGINDLKIFASGKNLYTLTKFTGWDPETGTRIGAGKPLMRSFVAGLNINF